MTPTPVTYAAASLGSGPRPCTRGPPGGYGLSLVATGNNGAGDTSDPQPPAATLTSNARPGWPFTVMDSFSPSLSRPSSFATPEPSRASGDVGEH
jgi:hypothetical protein